MDRQSKRAAQGGSGEGDHPVGESTEIRYVTSGREVTHLWRCGGDALCGRHVLSGVFTRRPTHPVCSDCVKELAYIDKAILPAEPIPAIRAHNFKRSPRAKIL